MIARFGAPDLPLNMCLEVLVQNIRLDRRSGLGRHNKERLFAVQ